MSQKALNSIIYRNHYWNGFYVPLYFSMWIIIIETENVLFTKILSKRKKRKMLEKWNETFCVYILLSAIVVSLVITLSYRIGLHVNGICESVAIELNKLKMKIIFVFLKR